MIESVLAIDDAGDGDLLEDEESKIVG